MKVRSRYSCTMVTTNEVHSSECAQPGLALSTSELVLRYSTAPDKIGEIRRYDSYSGNVVVRPTRDLVDVDSAKRAISSMQEAIERQQKEIEDASKQEVKAVESADQTA